MTREQEIKWLANEIQSLLHSLENTFWEYFVSPGYIPDEIINSSPYYKIEKEDKTTWLYYGTKRLYYKISLFLELKDLPSYYKMFTSQFEEIIVSKEKVLKSYGGSYDDSDPSMEIHDDFREFLSAFIEFDNAFLEKLETNKLKLILESTNSILNRTKTKIINESSVYTPVKWVVEIIFPKTRALGKARFIKKFVTYHPDILVPEISSAVEYKYIRKSENYEKYIDQLKTDADNYTNDQDYKFFYAVIYFECKSDINKAAWNQAIIEKEFPENWTIMVL